MTKKEDLAVELRAIQVLILKNPKAAAKRLAAVVETLDTAPKPKPKPEPEPEPQAEDADTTEAA